MCTYNPHGEAWESCICIFSGTSESGRTQLDLANVCVPGSRNSQDQQCTPQVWAPSQGSPITSTRAALPVVKVPGRAGHKLVLWLRGTALSAEVCGLWFVCSPICPAVIFALPSTSFLQVGTTSCLYSATRKEGELKERGMEWAMQHPPPLAVRGQ